MSLFQKFASVGGATLASRVLGFVREALIGALLGAGPVADAFYAAFRFPNLFRRLFAEGAFNSAFVPLFAKELEEGGRSAARDFSEKILSVLLPFLLLFSALAMIFMSTLVSTIIAPKFVEEPDKFELTVTLAQIMFPYLAAMSVVAMLSGILNSFRRYFLAALAPVVLNVVLVSILAWAANSGWEERSVGLGLAWGVFASGILQAGLLISGVMRQDFRMSLRVPRMSPQVKRLLVLALPTAIAGGITQINLLVGQIIASAQSGAIAIMNYADRLMQLPLGIIGISIGVVLLPELTRALAAGDKTNAQALQNKSLEFGLGLTIPAAIGLFLIPLPLVALVYERGAFDRETAEITAQVLAAFAIGLPSFVLIKIFQPSFYAREDMRTPMWFSAINAVTNIVLALLLFPRCGVVGLAIATSAAGWLNAILLWFVLTWGGFYSVTAPTLRNLCLIVLASGIMGLVLYYGAEWSGDILLEAGLLTRLGAIGLLIVTSMSVYFALVIVTGAVPKDALLRMVRRK